MLARVSALLWILALSALLQARPAPQMPTSQAGQCFGHAFDPEPELSCVSRACSTCVTTACDSDYGPAVRCTCDMVGPQQDCCDIAQTPGGTVGGCGACGSGGCPGSGECWGFSFYGQYMADCNGL